MYNTSTDTPYKDTQDSCPTHLAKRPSRKKKLHLGPQTSCKPKAPDATTEDRRFRPPPPRSEGAPSREHFDKPQQTLVPKNEIGPTPRSPSAGAAPRAPSILDRSSPLPPTAMTGTRARSNHQSSTRPTATSVPSTQKAGDLVTPRGRRTAADGLLYRDSTRGDPPPRARRRHQSGVPARRERDREDLIP